MKLNMNKIKLLLAVGALMAISGSVASAQIIYSNDFTVGGAVTIAGTAPTVANTTYAGGSSSAQWNNTYATNSTTFLANGTAVSNNNCTLLPFTPQTGYLYKLIGSVNMSADSQNWLGLGFAQYDPTNAVAASRFADASVNGYDWLIVNTHAGGAEQAFAGVKTAGQFFNSDVITAAGTYTLEVDLDTSGSLWKGSVFINGVQQGSTYTYTANPIIGAVGLTQNNANGTVTWNNLALSAQYAFASQPAIVVPPSNMTVVQGNPAAFNVTASGAPPLAYQWRSNSVPILNATNASYLIASPQPSYAMAAYDVIVTNNYGAVTSTPPANLIFYVPQNLTWLGSASFYWNTSDVNWDTNADNVADTAFMQEDNVTFDDNGLGQPFVDINSVLTPNSMTVNSSGTYTFYGLTGGQINGYSSLVKDGSGTLILNVSTPFTGPTTIKNGILQFGSGNAVGALPTGPITNNGTLLFNSTANFNLAGNLTGSGALSNLLNSTITITGTNTMSGPVYVTVGQLVLPGATAKGNASSYTLDATGSGAVGARLTLGGGITFDPSTAFVFENTSASPDNRCVVTTTSGTNTLAGAITLTGNGNVSLISSGPASNSLFQVTGPTINSPNFAGTLLLRGTGNGLLTSSLNTPLQVLAKTDNGIWTVTSTGNAWTNADNVSGTLQMGAVGVLPANATLTMEFANLDLNGFNQSVGMLVAKTNASTANGVIGNSSTSADATLTVNTTASMYIAPTSTVTNFFSIRDSLSGGTRKVGLTLAGGTLFLTGVNTYSGDTTVNAGILDLGASAVSTNSTYKLASGAVLNLDYAATVTNRIPRLVLNGVTQTNGVYSSANGSPYLTGTGNLIVGSAGPSLIPPQLTNSVSSGVLTLSWAADHLGYSLQMQTNSLNVGLSTNWVTVPGSAAVTTTNLPISPASPAVFYRLQYVP
jgi:autotransporter-associated beta strand protein